MNDVLNYYNNYDEEIRLDKSNLHKIEFFTTVHYLDKIIPAGSKILDVGAGAGRYSFYLAGKGHSLTAFDIVPRFIDIIHEKIKKTNVNMSAYLGDALDLSCFENESFDVVLCMGPLYHLKCSDERSKCIEECLRVLKREGMIAIAYINRFSAFVMEFRRIEDILNNEEFLNNIISNGCNAKADLASFYFSTPKEIENLTENLKIKKLYNVATDGIGYLIGDRINNLQEQEYRYWLDYHLKTCKDESLLGYSIHGLFIGRK